MNTSPQPLSFTRRGARGEVAFKKSLGQHYLRDEKILKRIADFAQTEKGEVVVEIGPGEGTLTKFLLERAERVIAVEKDARLVELLKQKFRKEIGEGRLEVINKDILKLELGKSSVKEPSERDRRELEEFSSKKISVRENRSFYLAYNYILVGNIPYYITGEIFRKFLESDNPPRSITFVVQKEVADRIMARDGKESVLSISVKAFGTPEYGGTIKAGSFVPAPKVDSAIISIRGITPLVPLTLRGEENKKTYSRRFFEIVKRGFSHKRKLLIKNLGTTRDIFKKCGIPEKARAEELSLNHWIDLTRELS